MDNRKKKNAGNKNDEVEEMLRQAEDAVMLKLSVNSHMAHVTDIDPDLHQRFQALKSGPTARKQKSSATTSSSTKNVSQNSTTLQEDNPDDLFKRFSALKEKLPKPSSSVNSSSVPAFNEANTSEQVNKLNGSDDEEDEVQKVIRWAIDAARLDPSPSSDDDDVDFHDSSDDDDDDYSCSDVESSHKLKLEQKKKGIPK